MKTILVVDDEPKITQLVRDYLERAGFAVRVAHDGKMALSAARAEKPDMVVLDLGLPRLSGLDLLKRLRDRGNRTPVVILTARDAVDARISGFDSGADDYLIKPGSCSSVTTATSNSRRGCRSVRRWPPVVPRSDCRRF